MVGLVLVQLVWKTQTDWMGGPGVLGPVEDWGTQFWASEGITYTAPGQVLLVAETTDAGGWEKEVLDDANVSNYYSLYPADFDGDEDLDVAGRKTQWVALYENLGGSFQLVDSVEVGQGAAGSAACTFMWAGDVNGDGLGDVITPATDGVYLLLSRGPFSFSVETLAVGESFESGVVAGDIDNDGDWDIVAGNRPGPLLLFRNDGNFNFEVETVSTGGGGFDWRLYLADFNGDGWLDIFDTPRGIFLNLGDGTFPSEPDYYPYPRGMDGAGVADFDSDGDPDFMLANYNGGYLYWYENDGTGLNYAEHLVFSGWGGTGDGAFAADLDLDGLADALSSQTILGVAFQVQPDSFELVTVDPDIGGGLFSASHWVIAAELDGPASCTGGSPGLDILLTSGYGQHVVYHNRTAQAFASWGYLESSVLDLYDGSDYGHPLEFYYKACVPNDSALEFWFRGGATVEQCTSSAWIGPFRAQAGVDSASFDIAGSFGYTRYFQYKVEFRGDSVDEDVAVLYEVGLGYELCPYGVDEGEKEPRKLTAYIAGRSTLKLELPFSSKVKVEVYEPTGRLITRIEKALPAGVHEMAIPGKGLRLLRLLVGRRALALKLY